MALVNEIETKLSWMQIIVRLLIAVLVTLIFCWVNTAYDEWRAADDFNGGINNESILVLPTKN